MEVILNDGYVLFVDEVDFIRFREYNICASATKAKPDYIRAIASKDRKNRLLSRMIMDVTDTKIYVDHIDGNTLNNQRSNLRLATPQQNSWNRKAKTGSTSNFLGVSKVTRNGKWMCQMKIDGKNKFLGFFKNECTAAYVFNETSYLIREEFTRLNVLSDTEIDIAKKEIAGKRKLNPAKAAKVVKLKSEPKPKRREISQNEYNSFYMRAMGY